MSEPRYTRDEILEQVATHVETLAGNLIYQQAWRKAAKSIRRMKSLIAKPEQIISSSGPQDDARASHPSR